MATTPDELATTATENGAGPGESPDVAAAAIGLAAADISDDEGGFTTDDEAGLVIDTASTTDGEETDDEQAHLNPQAAAAGGGASWFKTGTSGAAAATAIDEDDLEEGPVETAKGESDQVNRTLDMSFDADTVPKKKVGYRKCKTKKCAIFVGACVIAIAIVVGVTVPFTSNDSSSSDWTPLGTTLEGRAWNDRFGFSVSTSDDGRIVAVGAVSIDADASHRQVSVFKYEEQRQDWVQIGQNMTGYSVLDDFGSQVALNAVGDVLAVTTRPQSDLSNNGYVKVYSLDESSNEWQILGDGIFAPSPGSSSGIEPATIVRKFGHVIALDGTGKKLVVGAPGSTFRGNHESGAVFLYRYGENGTWNEVTTSAFDGKWSTGDHVGTTVGLSSDATVLAIGANPSDDFSRESYVQVYQMTSTDWTPQGIGQLDTPNCRDPKLGCRMVMSRNGQALAVGLPRYEYGLGSVQVYGYDSSVDEGWAPLGDAVLGDPGDISAQFGYALAIAGDGQRFASGSNFHAANGTGFGTGQTRVFEYDSASGKWTQVGQSLYGVTQGDEFGSSLAMSEDGDTLIVGSKFGLDCDGQHTGLVQVFTV